MTDANESLSSDLDLAAYIRGLWPPRTDAVLASFARAFGTEAWSRVGGDDWSKSSTGVFEREFAAVNESKFCLALNNGTTALELCLLALGVKPGDHVIVPALSFVATATAVSAVGAIPHFVDVDPETLNLDASELDAAVGERTVAAIAVHLAGVPCHMDAIVEVCRRRKLLLIEDCSHAHGSRWDGTPVGNFGDYGVFSLQQGKLLTCGEGAAVTTSREDLYRRLFSLQTFATSMANGLVARFDAVVPRNARLPSLLGSLLLPQLAALERSRLVRLENRRRFEAGLRDIPSLRPMRLHASVAPNTGYYVTYHYDPEVTGKTANDLTNELSSMGVPAFRGHNSPMYWREPYASGAAPYLKRDCRISEGRAPQRFINFKHEMFLAAPGVMDRITSLVRGALGAS